MEGRRSNTRKKERRVCWVDEIFLGINLLLMSSSGLLAIHTVIEIVLSAVSAGCPGLLEVLFIEVEVENYWASELPLTFRIFVFLLLSLSLVFQLLDVVFRTQHLWLLWI